MPRQITDNHEIFEIFLKSISSGAERMHSRWDDLHLIYLAYGVIQDRSLLSVDLQIF